MRVLRLREVAGLGAIVVALGLGSSAQAQWGYPGGYGGFGWGGWGGGVGTVQGSIASGLGNYAMGAGYYNQSTAVARSINADTVMRWNQYWWESQVAANKAERERLARRQQATIQTREAVEKRLRDNPEQRDIYQGDALNMAVEEITDPRAYARTMSGSNEKLPGQAVRNIPFKYAPAAVTISIHQIVQGGPPDILKGAAYETERTQLKELGSQVRAQIDEGKTPDPAVIDQMLAHINELENKVDSTLPRNSRDRVEADKYLKALHGLLAMMKTPALDVILAGVEKNPEVSLGQLLNFMRVFNLRFGVADTPEQRATYDLLWPKLDTLRDQVVASLASAAPMKATGKEAADFFEAMSYEDLKKKAPAPPKPGAPK